MKKIDRIVYETIVRSYQEELNTKDALNSKISTLLATTTAVITLYVSLGSMLYVQIEKELWLIAIIHLTGVGLLVVSMMCGLIAFEVLRVGKLELKQINPVALMNSSENNNETSNMFTIAIALKDAWKTHYKGNKVKDKWLTYAFYFLISGIFSMFMLLIAFIVITQM